MGRIASFRWRTAIGMAATTAALVACPKPATERGAPAPRSGRNAEASPTAAPSLALAPSGRPYSEDREAFPFPGSMSAGCDRAARETTPLGK